MQIISLQLYYYNFPTDLFDPYQFKNCFSRPIDWTLIGTIIPGQSGPGYNDNGEVLNIHQSSISKASTSDAV